MLCSAVKNNDDNDTDNDINIKKDAAKNSASMYIHALDCFTDRKIIFN